MSPNEDSPVDADPRMSPRDLAVLDGFGSELLHMRATLRPFNSTLEGEAFLREQMDCLSQIIRQNYNAKMPLVVYPDVQLATQALGGLVLRFLTDTHEMPGE